MKFIYENIVFFAGFVLLTLLSCNDSQSAGQDEDTFEKRDRDTSIQDRDIPAVDEDTEREEGACPQYLLSSDDSHKKFLNWRAPLFEYAPLKDKYATIDFAIDKVYTVEDRGTPITHFMGTTKNNQDITTADGERIGFHVSLFGYDLTNKTEKIPSHIWKLEQEVQEYVRMDHEHSIMSVWSARDKNNGLILASIDVGAYHDEPCPIWPSKLLPEFAAKQVNLEKCVPWKVESEFPSFSGPYDELIAPPVQITCKKTGETLLLKDGEIGEICNFQVHLRATRRAAEEDRDWSMEPTGMHWSFKVDFISLPLLNGTLY